MANQLKMAFVETLLRLHAQGWSQRRIARELGIDRAAVARHIRQAEAAAKSPDNGAADTAVPAGAKPARAPTGSADLPAESKPASAPPGSSPGGAGSEITAVAAQAQAGSVSVCAVWQAVIEAKLDLRLSARRIHQDLLSEHGFGGSYYSVRRFVQRLGRTLPLPFRRLECPPGEEAQIDFGKGAPIVDAQGRRRRPHVLRVVLVPPDDGGLSAVPGECLLGVRRYAAAAGDG